MTACDCNYYSLQLWLLLDFLTTTNYDRAKTNSEWKHEWKPTKIRATFDCDYLELQLLVTVIMSARKYECDSLWLQLLFLAALTTFRLFDYFLTTTNYDRAKTNSEWKHEWKPTKIRAIFDCDYLELQLLVTVIMSTRKYECDSLWLQLLLLAALTTFWL